MPTITRYGQTTNDPAQMAANRAALVNSSGGALQEVNGIVVPAAAKTNNPPPTVSNIPKRTPSLLETAQNEVASAAAARSTAIREAESYAATQRQARIDAINTAFAPRIAREKVEGDNRLSKVAALNFKTGTVGSGVDTTRTGDQKNLNEKAVQALEDEKATAINEAFGWADQLARQRAEDLYKEKTEGAEANVAKYKERADVAYNALKVFGAQGVTAEQLKSVDPNTYATLRDVSGMTDAAIDAYLKVNAPEGTYQWNAAQVHGSKLVVPKMINGKITTETVDLGFTPSKAIKDITKTNNGIFIIYDDGTHNIVPGSADGTGGGAGFTLSAGETRYDANGNPIATATGADSNITVELQQAQAAIDAGANPDDVRRMFLNSFPTKGDLFLKYTKQQY